MANLDNNKNRRKSSVEKGVEKVRHAAEDARQLASDAVNHPVETAQEFAGQAAKDVTNYKWWAKLLLILFWSGLTLITLILIAVNLDVTKRWAAQQALQILNQDFKAEMRTGVVTVDYFGDVKIEDLRIKDYRGLEFIKAREFRARSNWIALAANALSKNKNNSLSFDALQLRDADIRVITYKGDSISNFIRYINLFDSGKERDPDKPPFQLNSRVELLSSRLSIVNENSEEDEGRWLDAKNVNLIVPKLRVNGPDVKAQVNNFSFTTRRWGKAHTVDTFSGDLELTKRHLSLKNLTFYTDHSLLQGDLEFILDPKTGWQDFADKVRWNLKLQPGSFASGYDISYFATNWDNYGDFRISGKMTGPLNDFYLENFVVGGAGVSIATKTARLKSLLHKNEDFRIESRTLSFDLTYQGLKAMMPTFVAEKMGNFADGFGRMRYAGQARVTPKQVFIPSGNLIAEIGQASVRNFYLEKFDTDTPVYRGSADFTNLNAAAITHNKTVGLITGKVILEGQSFDVNKMIINAKAEIERIEILEKVLQNVSLDGLLNKKTYRGIISSKDANARADIRGFFDFSTRRFSADFQGDIDYLNLAYFSESPQRQILKGLINAKLSMTDLSDLQMDAELADVDSYAGGQHFQITSGSLKTWLEGGSRIAQAHLPGIAEGEIRGNFSLEDLPRMVESGLSKILAGSGNQRIYRGQDFSLNFIVNQGLMNYFLPELRLPEGAMIAGRYLGNSNDLQLDISARSLNYQLKNEADATDEISADNELAVKDLNLKIDTGAPQNQFLLSASRADFGNNIFRDIALSGDKSSEEMLAVDARFLHGTTAEDAQDKLQQYALSLTQTTDAAGDYVFRFNDTGIKFRGVQWQIGDGEGSHSIVFRKKQGDFLVQNLRLFSDDSELLIRNAKFKSAEDLSLDAAAKNFQIAKIFEMQGADQSIDFQGVANGEIKLDVKGKVLQPKLNLTVDDILMSGSDMGRLVLSAKESGVANIFDIDARIVSSEIFGADNLKVTGTVDANFASPKLDVSAKMNDFQLAFAQEFLKGVFSNIRGYANGELKIGGNFKDLDYSGDIALSGFGMKLDFTGADYSFEDTVINLSRGLAILNNIQVSDGRPNSSGNISGTIQFETLSNMGVNLIMRADNLILLNTTEKDSDLFWGRVYGQGDLFVSGPLSSLDISTPNMKALNNSVFTFNSDSTSNVEEFKMLRFLKADETGRIIAEQKKPAGPGINIDFTLAVDKGTTVNVLVAEDVGDISVRGTAEKLRFRLFRSGEILMNGDYFVDNGTFVSRAVLERTFQIVRGSSIRWDGDVMEPQLAINANYMRTVTNAGPYLHVGSLPPIDVVLGVNITGTLNSPEVNLDVTAPDLSSQLKETLATKMSNEDEKLIQFGSVLVLNSFNLSGTAGLDFDVSNQLESSGYNLLFKQLGSVLNTISNEFQIDMNYLKGDDMTNTGDRANATVTFSLSPRVSIRTGLGVPVTKTEDANNSYLSGEGIVEYDWSKANDGTRLLRVYSKPSNIGLVAGTATGSPSANQTYGVGVVYSKSFNTIFRRRNRTRKPADSIRTDSTGSSRNVN